MVASPATGVIRADESQRSTTEAGARQGRIVSLLASSDFLYQDQVTHEQILYELDAKTRQYIVKTFDPAMEEGHAFRVFFRRATNLWEDLGSFKAVGKEQMTGLLRYKLVPAER